MENSAKGHMVFLNMVGSRLKISFAGKLMPTDLFRLQGDTTH